MPQEMIFTGLNYTFGISPGNKQTDFRRIDPRVSHISSRGVVLVLPSALLLKVINEILVSAAAIHADSN